MCRLDNKITFVWIQWRSLFIAMWISWQSVNYLLAWCGRWDRACPSRESCSPALEHLLYLLRDSPERCGKWSFARNFSSAINCFLLDLQTITMDCECTPVLQLKAYRQKAGKIETSHYKATVSRFRGRLTIKMDYYKLFGDMKTEGYPEVCSCFDCNSYNINNDLLLDPYRIE